MRLGLCLRAFQDVSLESALDACAAFGFRSVEIQANASNTHIDVERVIRDSDYAGSIKELVEKRGLSIQALSVHRDSQLVLGPYDPRDSVLRRREWAKRRVVSVGRAAAVLGVPLVVGHLGCPDFSRWFPWPRPDAWRSMYDELKREWLPILKTLADFGVRFAHEPSPLQIAYNIGTCLDVLDVFDEQVPLGFVMDPANLTLLGVSPVEFVRKLRTNILHVHAKDGEFVHPYVDSSGWLDNGRWDRPSRGFRFRAPGWGSVQWKSVLSELQLIRYQGDIELEVEDPCMTTTEAIRKSLDYLGPLVFTELPPVFGG